MKVSSILSFVFLVTVSFSVFGQDEETKPVKRIIISDFYVQPFVFSEPYLNVTIQDFKALAPQSVLLNNNFLYFTNTYSAYSMSSNPAFSVLLGFQFSDKAKSVYKANPLLKLGICYYSVTSLTGYSYNDERMPYDTLTSLQTGNTVYIDSVLSKTYFMEYSWQQLRFDGSVIFRTDPGARWSLYAGIGITAGVSIRADTYISQSSNGYTEFRYPSGNTNSSYEYYSSYTDESEEFRNQRNYGISGYVPMGVDFRTGKKIPFWKLVHVFYELRPGITMTTIPELRTITNASIQHGVGLRVSWN
jgi:hypothetical protein